MLTRPFTWVCPNGCGPVQLHIALHDVRLSGVASGSALLESARLDTDQVRAAISAHFHGNHAEVG